MPRPPEQLVAPAPPIPTPDPARPLTAAEAQDFADVLRIRSDAIRTAVRTDKPAAEQQLNSYDDLVADPIKSGFASDPEFFAEIKRDVALRLVARVFPSTPAEDLRVLDVGCGTGALMRALEREFPRVRGCDPSLGMTCRAGPNAAFMPSPAELPFDDDSFDVATCACVYHHIEPHRRPAHLREIRRILRPGGVLMIFEHNPWNPLTRYIVHRCPIDAAADLLSAPSLRDLMRDAGYERIRSRYYLFLPQFLYRWFGTLERLLSATRLGGQYCAIGRKPD